MYDLFENLGWGEEDGPVQQMLPLVSSVLHWDAGLDLLSFACILL